LSVLTAAAAVSLNCWVSGVASRASNRYHLPKSSEYELFARAIGKDLGD